jgi:hypothetical protein
MIRSIFEVADILRVSGSSFLERNGSHLAWQHRKVMDAIVHCRTAALSGHRDRCSSGDHEAISYNSCRNRHCPKCQGNARAKWLSRFPHLSVLPSVFATTSAPGLQSFAAQWLACKLPCRRSTFTLADADARLGADVVRYAFIVSDFHRLLLAGLPAHCETFWTQPLSIRGQTYLRLAFSVR